MPIECDNANRDPSRKEYACKRCGRLLFDVDPADWKVLYIKRGNLPKKRIDLGLEEEKLLKLPCGSRTPIKNHQFYLCDHISDYIDPGGVRHKFHIETTCPKCGRGYRYNYKRERLALFEQHN